MGIRKSTGKNKKSRKRAPAIAVRREEFQRLAASDRSKSRPLCMR
jgi:hypothetical protein